MTINNEDPLFLGSFCKNRIGHNIVYDNIVRIGKRCGLKTIDGRPLNVKDMRHTWTKNAKKNGMNPDLVAEERGDKREKSQDNYCKYDTEELKGEYDKYIFALPKNGQKAIV